MMPPRSEPFTGYRGSVRGGPHKEWFHFIICSDQGLKILLNFSVMVGVQTSSPKPIARALGMMFADGDWVGDMYEMDVCVARGATEISEERSSLRVTERGFAVEFQSKRLSIELDLVAGSPAIVTNRTPIGSGSSLRWLSVPKMQAFGEIVHEGATLAITGAPAYHDHNWGSFRWGEDYSWDWAVFGGFDVFDPVYIYCQFTDTDQRRCLSRTLTVCESMKTPQAYERAFFAQRRGLLCSEKPFRLPKGMQMAMSGWRLDVPKRLELLAGDDSSVLARIEPTASAQIVIPGDCSDGSDALLTESVGRATFRHNDEQVSGWSVLEQLRRQA